MRAKRSGVCILADTERCKGICRSGQRGLGTAWDPEGGQWSGEPGLPSESRSTQLPPGVWPVPISANCG